MMAKATAEEKKWMLKYKREYTSILSSHDRKLALRRINNIDKIVNNYISRNPNCTVINLACGFDTRYWRINNKECKYIELDLPEVIALKKDLFGDNIPYELIGSSVLVTAWLDKVTAASNQNILLIAEGISMFLPKDKAINLFSEISRRLKNSQIVFDYLHSNYTKGLWKWLAKKVLGVYWVFGIDNPKEIETFASSLKVLSVEKGSMGPIA